MLQQVEVKELTTAEELEQLQALDKEIWEEAVLPTHQTLGAIRNGGILLGAYYKGELVGFSYSFIGFNEGQMYVTSHKLGVKQVYREHGIGELLKHTQKEIAKERGYDEIRWVIDPLVSTNALLGFKKLGAISQTYVNDYYGELHDYFNSGLPSDRIIVEWWVQRERATDVIEELTENAKPIVPWEVTIAGLPAITRFDTEQHYTEDAYTVAIPHYFHKLKIESPQLAEDWRYKIRAILTTLFAQGYAIVDVLRGEQHVNHYVIAKRSLLAL
ncbi:GNAT family N-acetyltransferase [Metalysinibacillus jejuensis]|uniref:GNAT family N-acetyltransferase n=1 Tax=Metalysinibacillus jejuensis TaxID=914327 RepID=UPI000D3B4B84|nr:GNAT family N-acetyltransferase [Metalysinibacillus jejuensis]